MILFFSPGIPEMLSAQDHSTAIPGIFQDIRLINLPTPVQTGKRALGFRISHRLGYLSDGSKSFFGIDGPGSIYLALDLGIRKDLMAGISRSSLDQLVSGYAKYTPLNQSEDNAMPLSGGLLVMANVTTMKDMNAIVNGFDKYSNFANRISFTTQFIVSRKFNNWLSVEIVPSWIHFNLVERKGDANDVFAVSAGGMFKLTKRFALTGEYSYVLNEHVDISIRNQIFNSAAFGFEAGTGGHVFQIHLTNSFGIVPTQYIAYTSGDWLKGNARIGFNISRIWWF